MVNAVGVDGGADGVGGAPLGLRVGEGFDVHRFSDDAERPLILGGVVVTGEGARGLVGHSDADALAHAVADAVLGAAGLGDLGTHAPDTDPRWRGADSIGILAEMVGRARSAGWMVVNADCTVLAERPHLAPFVGHMADRLTETLGAPANVKATRAEGLGALGRAEGVAARAVVLLAAAEPTPSTGEG